MALSAPPPPRRQTLTAAAAVVLVLLLVVMGLGGKTPVGQPPKPNVVVVKKPPANSSKPVAPPQPPAAAKPPCQGYEIETRLVSLCLHSGEASVRGLEVVFTGEATVYRGCVVGGFVEGVVVGGGSWVRVSGEAVVVRPCSQAGSEHQGYGAGRGG